MSKRSSISYSAKAPEGAPRVWRSLEERENPDHLREAAASENEVAVDRTIVSLGKKKSAEKITVVEGGEKGGGLGRRHFMALGGIAAAAGLSGCARRPAEHILPFTRQPEYSL